MSDRTAFDTGEAKPEARPDFELDPGLAGRSHGRYRTDAGEVPTGAGGADPVARIRHLPVMQEEADARLGNDRDGRLHSQ